MGGTIVDLAREHAVLAEAESGRRGLNPAQTTAVLQDQIEASKVVQYGLFADWTADPGRAPAAAPDLDRVRPELDRITTDLLDQLAATRPLRAGRLRGGRASFAADSRVRAPGYRLYVTRFVRLSCRYSPGCGGTGAWRWCSRS